MVRITPENITELKHNEVFVFGSNEAGIHGAGAAFLACRKFGAISGQGFGLAGQSFAIPTKDWNIKTLSIYSIKEYVDHFIDWVEILKTKNFLVTQIGCGLAGFTPQEIAPLFRKCIDLENVYLPQSFWEVLL